MSGDKIQIWRFCSSTTTTGVVFLLRYLTLKMKAQRSFRPSEIVYRTECKVLEGMNSQ